MFPPIPVDDWTTENLSERIAEVRQLYLDTLRHWPQGALPDAPLYARSPKPATKAPPRPLPRRRRHRQEDASQEGRGQEDAATKTAAKKAAAKKPAAKANPAPRGTAKGRP